MMKKIVAIVVTILITMSLAACNLGGGEKQGKDHMVAVGTTSTASIEMKDGEKYSFSMCVDKLYRGEEALNFINDKMMEKKTMFKAEKPKEADQEYIVAKITYKLLSCSDGDTKKVNILNAFNAKLEPYPMLLAGMFYDKDNGYPELQLMEPKVGETIEGYGIFQVKKDDKTPCMSCASFSADHSDGLWFQLYEK